MTDEEMAETARQIRASVAYTFMCSADSYIAPLDAEIDPQTEVRMLRRLVRDLQSQLDARYKR